MAKQVINIGAVVNDPGADIIRDAFDKCNDNFNELYAFDRLSVMDYGAVGDGVADDKQALLDCAAAAIAQGKICYLPAGTYRIVGNYCFTVADGETLRVEGAGSNSTTIAGAGSLGQYGCENNGSLFMRGINWIDFETAIELKPNTTNATIYTHLRDLRLYHNMAGSNRALINTPQSGPHTGATNVCDFENLDISVGALGKDCTLISMRGGCSNSVFRRITFTGGQKHYAAIPSGDPGLVDPSHAGDWYRDCVWDNNRHVRLDWDGTSVDSYSMMVAGIGWTISNCYFGPCSTNSQSGGIYCNLHNSVIENNTFDTCGGVGHLFFKGSERLSPSTTVVNGWGWGNLIQGNTFKGYTTVNGGHAQINMNVKEQTIKNNRFENWHPSAGAISANQQGSVWRNLVIDSNTFGPSAESIVVLQIDQGCESLDFTNNYMVDLVRTAGIAHILFEQVGGSPRVWRGVKITGNKWFNCQQLFLSIRTAGSTLEAEIKNNLIDAGTADQRGWSTTSHTDLILKLVWEGNVFNLNDRAWSNVASGYQVGSEFKNNVWTQTLGTLPAPAYANGLESGLLVAELPPADEFTGRIAYVTDGAAGSPCTAVSDGVNWIRNDSLAPVSAV